MLESADPARVPVRWYVTAVLVIIYITAFLDRQILSLLVEPIKRDLNLSDTQISLLQGVGFAGIMSLAGLPIGRLVDTRSRTRIVAAGTLVWSVMTASCGLARGFGELLLGRMGVGAGEACLTPAAYSLLADCFPPKRHGLVFGIYGLGAYLGLGLSYIIGGEVIGQIAKKPALAIPWFGEMPAWRMVFMAVGIPGLLVAAWGATLREPTRQETSAHTAAEPSSLAEVRKYFCDHWQPIFMSNLCVAFAAMTAYSITAWTPTFFIRTYAWTASQTGTVFGVAVALSGTLGYLLGGWAGDVLVTRGVIAGRLNLLVGAALLAIPLTVSAPLMDDPHRALRVYAGAMFFVALAVGSGPVLQVSLVPSGLRGTAVSLGVLTVNSLGLGLGPTAVALVTDYLIGDESKIRYALAAIPAVMLFLCGVFGIRAIEPVRRCVRQLNRRDEVCELLRS